MNKRTKTAAVIIIGDEILSGRTQDTNIQTIATRLGEIGIALSEVRIIPDVIETIVSVVNEIRARVDYVFTTGGIGPTHDDKTAEAIAKAFGVELERNAEAWRRLVAYYGDAAEMNPGRARMARIPVGAALIDNPVSVAPGFRMDNVHVMAGVPKIMEGMLGHIVPTLEGGAKIHSLSVGTDLAESVLADGLEEIEKGHPGVSIGSYPRFQPGRGPFTVIVARGIENETVQSSIDAVAELMRRQGGTPQYS